LIVISFKEDRSEKTVTRKLTFGQDEIFYEFVGGVLPAPIADLDAALVASVFMAMSRGEPIHVAGAVSATLLENIEEFQRAWALLRPSLFKVVPITADEEISKTQSPNTAVIAYSGGVDANSSLAFHMEGYAGRRKRVIEAAVLIHGMDVPIDKDFSIFENIASATLSHYNIPLTVVRTNWRKYNPHWEMVFIAGITGCLHQFNVGYGILSSDEDYGSIVMPWSSNPATNHLLSGIRTIQTEGTGFTRTQKVRMLPSALTENLRVCWQDVKLGANLNCGRCEKCIRTKMNFEANGMEPPACLGPKVSRWDALRPLAKNQVQRNYLVDALRFARQNGVEEEWVKTLPIGLFLSKLKGRTAPLSRKVMRRMRLVKG
jgi:hypothetical protein